MARRKTLPESVRAKYALAERLSMLRAELFGDRGGPELARQLGLPVRTWYNYESGVTVPAEVILKIIELTSVEPMWLLHGKGPKFRTPTSDRRDTLVGPGVSVGALLRTALQMLEQGEATPPTLIVSKSPAEASSGDEHADVVLIAVDETAADGPITRTSGPRYLAARSEWLDAERECRVIRIEGNAMFPIVADGAYVAFSKTEENPADLDGAMVVAWVEGQHVVRWFQFCGRYAVLRAENPATTPTQVLVDLEDRGVDHRFRRVLWINTPH
jgi:SOS-response transcriptional repressor LexA